MKLKLDRKYKLPEYTIGKLYIDGEYFCDTLEDTDRGLSSDMPFQEIIKRKIQGKTAVPTGDYKVNMNTVSPRFKDRTWAKPYQGKLPRLIDTIGFEGVLIHVGNSASDTTGCVLVGKNTIKGKLTNSATVFRELMEILLTDKDNITISII